MRHGNERKSSSSSSPALDCDVGLGLKMQLQPSDGPFFSSNTSNQVACGGDSYEAAADTLVSPRTFHNPTAWRTSPGGGMAVSGKALFTASQWQELERQRTIHKYIMASIPIPPQLLLPTTSSSPAPLPSRSQSNTSPIGLELRYSSMGSDPEPWRCKRTDGKKWRCSRDVAPDQKYCERHAHKTRIRSRKHVELSSSLKNTSNVSVSHQKSSSSSSQLIPTMASPTSYDQTSRCSIEWFMRGSNSSGGGDNAPISTYNQQQWQQVMQISQSSSSRLEVNRENKDQNKSASTVYQPQGFTCLTPYNIPDTFALENDSKMGSGLSSHTQTTTRHFIDAWESEGLSTSLSNKFSPSSNLTLSMSGGGDHNNNENGCLGNTGTMINSDRDSEYGILKPVISWMNSPPGGPLGEALCLGNIGTTTTRGGGSNLASLHGYSNSNTNSSSCSKSSCEDGNYALNFIG